jgi:hypothetical protein
LFPRVLARVPFDGRSIAGQLLWAVTLVGLGLLSWHKGLNFDESLALRSGWLALQHADASPVLWSPWTLVLGSAAHAVDDPAIVLRLARGLAVVWISSGVWANTHGRDLGYGALALLLGCCFDPVIAHLVEFRYDASLLGASLWYVARLRDPERPLSVGAGLWLGLLATHQLKGLALAALLLAISVLVRPSLRQLRSLCAGALAFSGAWLLLSLALGQGARLCEGYLLFLELAQVSPPPALDVRGSLPALFVLVLAAVGLSLWRAPAGAPLVPSFQRLLAQHAAWLAFAVLAVVHPRLFAYHLTPIELSLALVVATELQRLSPGRLWLFAAAVPLASMLGSWSGRAGSSAAIQRLLRTPLAATITTLRAVRSAQRPGDRVFDPAGVLYFMPPCGREWYLDSLFAEWAQQGRWMYAPLSPPCTWVLRTQRLALVPPQHLAGLGPFQLQRGTGGLLTSEAAERHIEPRGLGDSTPSTW